MILASELTLLTTSLTLTLPNGVGHPPSSPAPSFLQTGESIAAAVALSLFCSFVACVVRSGGGGSVGTLRIDLPLFCKYPPLPRLHPLPLTQRNTYVTHVTQGPLQSLQHVAITYYSRPSSTYGSATVLLLLQRYPQSQLKRFHVIGMQPIHNGDTVRRFQS